MRPGGAWDFLYPDADGGMKAVDVVARVAAAAEAVWKADICE